MADQAGGLLSPWLRGKRIAAVRDRLSGRVLDVGCGVGALAAFVPAERYLGVDADAASIAEARRRRPSHRFETVPRSCDWIDEEGIDECSRDESRDDQSDGNPVLGGRFDTIVLLAVIEHLPGPAELLCGLRRRLAPGGTIVITTPAPALEWVHSAGARLGLFSADASEEHESLIGPVEMDGIARRAGLALVDSHRFLAGANQRFTLAAAPE